MRLLAKKNPSIDYIFNKVMDLMTRTTVCKEF